MPSYKLSGLINSEEIELLFQRACGLFSVVLPNLSRPVSKGPTLIALINYPICLVVNYFSLFNSPTNHRHLKHICLSHSKTTKLDETRSRHTRTRTRARARASLVELIVN